MFPFPFKVRIVNAGLPIIHPWKHRPIMTDDVVPVIGEDEGGHYYLFQSLYHPNGYDRLRRDDCAIFHEHFEPGDRVMVNGCAWDLEEAKQRINKIVWGTKYRVERSFGDELTVVKDDGEYIQFPEKNIKIYIHKSMVVRANRNSSPLCVCDITTLMVKGCACGGI